MGYHQRKKIGLVRGDDRFEVFAIMSQNLAPTFKLQQTFSSHHRCILKKGKIVCISQTLKNLLNKNQTHFQQVLY